METTFQLDDFSCELEELLLLRRLKALGKLWSHAPEDNTSAIEWKYNDLAVHLSSEDFTSHDSIRVRLLTAYNLAQVLRIRQFQHPYGPQLYNILLFLIYQLERVAPERVDFQKYQEKIVEILLMKDVITLFWNLNKLKNLAIIAFSIVIKSAHPDLSLTSKERMVKLVGTLVEHLPNVPSEIIQMTLINCQNKKKVSNVMAYDVTVEFIWKYKDTLAPAIGKVMFKDISETFNCTPPEERESSMLVLETMKHWMARLWRLHAICNDLTVSILKHLESSLYSMTYKCRYILILFLAKMFAKPSNVPLHKVCSSLWKSFLSRTRAVQVVRNLSGLIIGANICERDSIEELVHEWVISEDIGGHCIKVLWERFSGALPGTTPNESRAAAVLLGMVAGAEVQTIWTNLDVMVKVGLKGERGQPETENGDSESTYDSLMVSETCEALLKMSLTHKKKQDPLDPPLRLPSNHIIFTTLCDIVLKGLWDFQDYYYTPMASLAIDVIYQMAEKPDSLCGQLIKDICTGIKDRFMLSKAGEGVEGTLKESQALTQGTTDNVEKPKELMGPPAPLPPPNSIQIPVTALSRLMFVVGHVAFREFVYLDTQVFTELKRRNNVREKLQEKDQAGKKGKQKSKRSGGASANMSSKTLSVSASEKSRHEVSKSEDGEDDVIGAIADDAEAEFIRNVCEMELVSGNNLLALLCPMVVMVCAKPKKYQDSSLRVSVVLALAKYMCVSSAVCQKYMQLLVTVMERSPEPVIRANCIIALGDLCYRFPNITEPWSPNLYGRLRDMSDKVRQNTLMVLTHLIMNDMVKVKGQISDMALCILDPCEKIRGISKLFFQELAQKGNALYNVMTDIISRLSNPSLGVPEESFQTILSFLVQLITKDRLVDSLVEKLCLRFQTTSSGAFMDNAPAIPKENPLVIVSDGMSEKTPMASEEAPALQQENKDDANEDIDHEKPESVEVKTSGEVGKDAREEDEKRQWRDLAFCLSLLPYNSERAIRRLMSHMPCYADKIAKEPQVYAFFASIVEAAKKAAKAEMKAVVDEFEQKIEECIKTADEEGNVPDAFKKTVQTPAKKGTRAVPRSVTKSVRPRRKVVASSSSESDFESPTENQGKKPQSAVKSVQKRRGRPMQPVDSDDEDAQPAARSKRNPRRKVTYDGSGSEKENNQQSSEEDKTPSPEPKKPKRGTRAAPRSSSRKSARNKT